MNANKLREALAEMEAERRLLDESIESVRLVIARVEGQAIVSSGKGTSAAAPRSYIDDAVELFQAVGKPIHVRDIAQRISEKKSESVSRGSLESSFVRHIKKAARPRIAKFGPSMFGLIEWKRPHSAFSGEPSVKREVKRAEVTIFDRIAAFFRARPEQVIKATDLAKELGIPRDTVYARLGELCKKGVIDKVEPGAYRLKNGDLVRQMPLAV